MSKQKTTTTMHTLPKNAPLQVHDELSLRSFVTKKGQEEAKLNTNWSEDKNRKLHITISDTQSVLELSVGMGLWGVNVGFRRHN
jgi:hypothetical protein